MTFIPITNACAAELRFTFVSQQVELTLGFYKSSGIGGTDLQTLADFLGEWWYNSLRAQMGSAVSLREIYCRDLTSESAAAYTSTTRAGTAGTLSPGTTLPPNVAFCISFRTALRGRANRGRNYWFGFGTSQIASNTTIGSAYRTAVMGKYSQLLPGGAYDPTPFRWSVLSRQLNGVVGGRAVPITTVTVANDVLDSMRTRLPGRGL